MSNPNEWRAQAARLLAMATAVQGRGQKELSEIYTAAAMRYLDKATAAEDAVSTPPPAVNAPQASVQQQQQPQPKPSAEKE